MAKRKRVKYTSGSLVNIQKTFGDVSATGALDLKNAAWEGAANTPNSFVTAKGRALNLGVVEAGTSNRSGGARIAHDVKNNKTTFSGQTGLGGLGVGGTYNTEGDVTLNAQKQVGRTGVRAAYDSRGSGVNLSAQRPFVVKDATGQVYGRVNTSNIKDLTIGTQIKIPLGK